MCRRKRGFTLTELLIVLAVLGLLVAIMLPTFGKVVAMGRRASCQVNLAHIGQAYHMRRAAEPSGERTAFKANHWTADLLPYLGDHPDAMYCLEDEDPFDGLPDLKFWVHAGYHMEMSSAYPYWLEGSARQVAGGVPGVWKLNDEAYQSIGSSLRERVNAVDRLIQFTPGVDRRLYWYVFEDQRSGEGSQLAADDKDFEDLIVRVFETPTGSVVINCWKGATIHHFDLIGPDEDGNEVTIASDIGSTAGPFSFPGAKKISYGMNWQAEHITGGLHKILALDYETEVCNVGNGAPAVTEGWDTERAPRHFDKANVLFSDGQVVAMDVDEIDPDLDANDGLYWDPTR